MLKRVMTSLLSLAVVLALTAQTVPHVSSPSHPVMSSAPMDMSACAPSSTPCKTVPPGHVDCPGCIDGVGCMTVFALSATITAMATPITWTNLAYASVDVALIGRTTLPDIFPPILRA